MAVISIRRHHHDVSNHAHNSDASEIQRDGMVVETAREGENLRSFEFNDLQVMAKKKEKQQKGNVAYSSNNQRLKSKISGPSICLKDPEPIHRHLFAAADMIPNDGILEATDSTQTSSEYTASSDTDSTTITDKLDADTPLNLKMSWEQDVLLEEGTKSQNHTQRTYHEHGQSTGPSNFNELEEDKMSAVNDTAMENPSRALLGLVNKPSSAVTEVVTARATQQLQSTNNVDDSRVELPDEQFL